MGAKRVLRWGFPTPPNQAGAAKAMMRELLLRALRPSLGMPSSSLLNGNLLIAKLLPLIYAACFLALLWQAFRIMGRGFSAVPRPGDQERMPGGDRTGRVTIHPELLDAEGQLTRDDLLTVRFGDDSERPGLPNDPG